MKSLEFRVLAFDSVVYFCDMFCKLLFELRTCNQKPRNSPSGKIIVHICVMHSWVLKVSYKVGLSFGAQSEATVVRQIE